MTAADVERELDPRIDLRFIELREEALLAPLRSEVRGVHGLVTERKK